MGNFETASVFSLFAFMLIGYVGGLKKLTFAVFIYEVPLKMLRGEFERYFAETNKKQDPVILALGAFLMIFSLATILGLKPAE